MSPIDARRLVGQSDIVERLREFEVEMRDILADRDTRIDILCAEIERLRTALRAVRASADPRWQAQIISDALRETP